MRAGYFSVTEDGSREPRSEQRRRFIPGTLVLTFMLAVANPALAAKVRLGNSSGGNPTPIQGSNVGVSFNPSVTLSVQAEETSAALLLRLAEEINLVSAGAYTAHVSEPIELEILRSTGEEIDDLQFTENDGSIQSVALSLSQPQLIARIGVVQEDPSAGTVVLTLNDRSLVVETRGLRTAYALNVAILQAIERAGFLAEAVPGFIVVLRDLRTDQGLRKLGWRSTDPAIIRSDLALQPDPSAVP